VTLVWVFVAVVVVVGTVFVAAGFGAPAPEPGADRAPLDLPGDRALAAADLASLRLSVALRGYRMDEVDDVLDRLAVEIAHRDALIAQLSEGAVLATAVPLAPDASPAGHPTSDGDDAGR